MPILYYPSQDYLILITGEDYLKCLKGAELKKLKPHICSLGGRVIYNEILRIFIHEGCFLNGSPCVIMILN